MKTVSQLNADGIFVGPVIADESPLEPGVLLLPAGAVDLAPPLLEAGQFARFIGGDWLVDAIPQPEQPAQPPARTQTQEQIEADRVSALKLTGIEFEGVMCSATKDDQNGLVAVLTAYQLQGAAFQPTRYDFANGNSLVITKNNIQQFIAVWLPFRQGFFASVEHQ